MIDTPVSVDWLRENNAVAAAILRGASTPESRRDHLVREYERAASSVAAPAPVARSDSSAAPQGDALRFPWADDMDATEERDPFGKFEQTLYGLGRALERAIQEARGFEHVDVGALGKQAW